MTVQTNPIEVRWIVAARIISALQQGHPRGTDPKAFFEAKVLNNSVTPLNDTEQPEPT
jgi:hypothetical protein